MGQSAGAHLAAMLLLEHGLLEAKSFSSVFVGKIGSLLPYVLRNSRNLGIPNVVGLPGKAHG